MLLYSHSTQTKPPESIVRQNHVCATGTRATSDSIERKGLERVSIEREEGGNLISYVWILPNKDIFYPEFV